jgi:hypothetical protein
MDTTLSPEERARLRAETIAALQTILVEQESRLPRSLVFSARVPHTSPQERERVNQLVDQLRRAGERIYASDYDHSPIIPPDKAGRRPDERIATDQLVITIKRLLARIDSPHRWAPR